MANIALHDLRALQSTLNAAIDVYETSPDPDTTAEINKAAKAIAAGTRGTSTDFIGLGFQPLKNTVIRIGIDLDLFNIIEENVTLDHSPAKQEHTRAS
ncbi:uncharacterized protein N0V89_004469 [Didymosphaeria variabile]|uniref:Uncharacterized protein n=1 Tax=Didymosphaeria variabile TaxID=1932322 RepID=A0A9W8XRW8_9PLEO|nr:uncharacterized protein N0V89_004469 [Didymosphaeria variabile]KAJ4356436.1 hypothetical protein N0V89_004469 [Didymosphaeria variabile]